MTARLVLGVDAGGSGTRCVAATLDGVVVGRGEAGGANQRSSGDLAATRANLAAALRQALGAHDPARVAGGVLGIAGAGAAGHAVAAATAAGAWREAGLPGTPEVVPDLAVAFAGATDATSGTLLLAGTGAVAARFEGGMMTARSDGHGWLLGDEGSGVWLGLQALRAVLAALDGRAAATALTGPVLAELLGADTSEDAAVLANVDPAALCQRLVAVCYPPRPARLGALAPHVDSAARAGDPTAAALVAEAARLLLRTLRAISSPSDRTPLVLAGSLLLRETLVADHLAAALAPRNTLPSRHPAPGAAALALRALLPPDDAAAAHARLLGDH